MYTIHKVFISYDILSYILNGTNSFYIDNLLRYN